MEQQQTRQKLSEIISENEKAFDALIEWIIANYNGICGIQVNFSDQDRAAFYDGMMAVAEMQSDWYTWETFKKVIKAGMLGKYGPVYNLSARQVNSWLMEHRKRENSKI